MLVNSPFGGAGYGSIYISYGSSGHGSTTILAVNGSVWGYFDRDNWTVSAAKPARGTLAGCEGRYYPALQGQGGPAILEIANGSISNFSNDAQEPNNITTSWTGGPVFYYNRFYSATSEISTCGSGAQHKHVTSAHITIGIPLGPGGAPPLASLALTQKTSYNYTFPANFGTWAVDNLSAPGGPGGGWAFSYSPCP